MSSLLKEGPDPDGLLEYSVVYTDRALNHMSKKFQRVMNDLSSILKEVYSAKSVAIVPGSGTFGMESVARQFALDKKCLIIRNGWFSFRWSQILETGRIAKDTVVMKASRSNPSDSFGSFSPPHVNDVIRQINEYKPEVLFMPHVETSSGIILPDDYIQAIASAMHSIGGLVVLDCVASGTLWVDMKENGVDILISAPQKGWSGSPCCAFVMMNEATRTLLDSTASTSFALDLKKWCQIMEAYENGGFAYHATMPTDALSKSCVSMLEAKDFGFAKLKQQQIELGENMRTELEAKGYLSVAAEGFKSPTVIVSYTSNKSIQNTSSFTALGVQIAPGVPLQCDEGADFCTFRIGLFGLEKLYNTKQTVNTLLHIMDKL